MNKLLVLITLAVSVQWACKTSAGTSSNAAKGDANKRTYLALGDSYTVGETVEQPYTFPYILVNELAQKDFLFQEPVIIAKTGWRTDELLSEAQRLQGKKFDLVSLCIGVNNQYQKMEMAQFEAEFPELLEMAIGYSKTAAQGVFVFTIPDYGVMPIIDKDKSEYITEQLIEYNNRIKDFARQKDVVVYDIFEISRRAKTDQSFIGNDKLHPSGKMYQAWIDKNIDNIIKYNLK